MIIIDEKRIFERSAVIQVAIDARCKHFKYGTAFEYKPFQGLEDEYRFTEATFNRVIKAYNTRDLAI